MTFNYDKNGNFIFSAKTRVIFIIIAVAICIIYMIIIRPIENKQYINSYNRFNSVNISGEIVEVDIKRKSSAFRIEKSDSFYIFVPHSVKSNNNRSFLSIASRGDSVYKAAYSDTLKLFHNGDVYLYTFHKPKEEYIK